MESLETMRAEFYEALEGLKEVHTQEALDAQKVKLDAAKKRLLEVDPEFRNMIADNRRKAKIRSDRMKAEHKASMAESKAKSDAIRSNALARARSAEADVDKWVSEHKIRIRTPEEAEKKSKEKLWCPICRKRDTSNNILNGVPTCFDPSHRPHKLVPKSELRDYNRAYRKKWLIRRKK